MEKLIEKFIFSLLPLVYLSLLPLPPPPLVLLHTDAGIIWLYAEPMIDRVFYSLRTYPLPSYSHCELKLAGAFRCFHLEIFPTPPEMLIISFVLEERPSEIFFIFEIRKNINCEIFVSWLILVFLVDFIFCSFFLSFWGWFK